jgi:serine/threonine-protein kinase PknG
VTVESCGQPGCTGTIEDGYCTVCGPASVPTAARTLAASAPLERVEPDGTATVTGRSSVGSGRGSLGAGMLEIPPIQSGDPAAAVMDNPEVPERKRMDLLGKGQERQ